MNTTTYSLRHDMALRVRAAAMKLRADAEACAPTLDAGTLGPAMPGPDVRPAPEASRFAVGSVTLPDHPLPPTRAARSPRSRGVFLAASAHSRIAHWIVNALCIALAVISIVAGAEFAEPALDAKFVTSNAGPPLVASAMRAPFFVAPRPH